jgi:protein-tyrosine-phosphatase
MVPGKRSRLLFVCAGNTCRSPMAAALAASVAPEVDAQSAGLMPGHAVAENAISVVRQLTGIDISGHHPSDVAKVDLTRFDRIIALDHMVAEELAPLVPADVSLLVWDVRDPYGGSIEDYLRCAEVLRARIEGLAHAE